MENTTLTIAGSDSGGGAGIQADIKTMEAFGVFATSVVTAVTAQNTRQVSGIEELPPSFVGDQIDSVVEDFDIKIAKTGMLSNSSIINEVTEKADQHNISLIVDPVMVAASGDRLLRKKAEESIRENLLPNSKLITPNIIEAEILSGIDITSEKSMRSAAKKIVDMGAQSVLIKGGHLDETRDKNTGNVTDILYTSDSTEFKKPKINTTKTHGTGCALSSAIAAELSKGKSLHRAVGNAEEFIFRAINFGLSVGEKGCVNHMSEMRKNSDIYNSMEKVRNAVNSFENENISSLIPEVGLNFAVAPLYSLYEDEIAAIEGRLRTTLNGVFAKGIWIGVSDHVARLLLEFREFNSDIEAVVNIKNNQKIEQKIEDLGWSIEKFDRQNQPEGVNTMEWSVRKVMKDREKHPDAVIDSGAIGKEPMIRLISKSAEDLTERVLKLSRRID